MAELRHQVSRFELVGKPVIYFKRLLGNEMMAQYAMRPPELTSDGREYEVGENVYPLTRMGPRKEGHGLGLFNWAMDIFGDFATHTRKPVRIRLKVANQQVVEHLEKNGFKRGELLNAETGLSFFEKIIKPKKRTLNEERLQNIQTLLGP